MPHLAMHDLASALVRRGFVVVAVTHPGDNAHDHRRLGTLSNLYGRPLQIFSRTLGRGGRAGLDTADQ